MTTVLGIPPSRFAFAYVDELLACFTTHPQKSTQQVFQRLLITAGREVDAVSEHIARVLLTSIGYGENIPGILSESAGANLFKLICRYGMEEMTGRNEVEMRGATSLLLYLAEVMSEHLSLPHSFVGSAKFYRRVNTAAAANSEGQDVCKNDCFQYLIMDDPHLQAGFATLLTVINELEPLVDQLIEDGLGTMVEEFQARQTKYPLRVEYFQTIVHCFLKSKMQAVCPLGVCRLINSVVHDTTREPIKMKRPLQPLLFNLLAKKRNVNANLSLEKLFYQAADVVRKGCSSLGELEFLVMECRAYRLTHALMAEAGKLTHTPAGCREFLKSEIPKLFLTPDAIANAVIAMISSEQRIGAQPGSETGGRLPWSPSILAKALTEYNNMIKEKWAQVFTELDQPAFRFVSEAGIIFFIQFFEATSFGFPIHIMFLKWNFVDGQLDFFERVIRKNEGGFIDLHTYKASDISCLEPNPKPDFLYCNMRCLELYNTLLTIEFAHPGCKGRVQDIVDYMISQYPEVVFISMFQLTECFTEYAIHIMLMSLEPLIEKLHKQDDPKHLRRILKHAVSLKDHEFMDHEVICRSVASLIIRQNQMHFMTSAPKKIEFTQRCLRLMHDVDVDIIKYALEHCDMESSFELALVCHGLGFCNFDEYLRTRLDLNEKQLLRFLVKELKNKKFYGYTSVFVEKVTHFLQENIGRLKRHDLEPPAFLKPVMKSVPVAAVAPPKKEVKKAKEKAKKEKKTKTEEKIEPAPKRDIFDETCIEIDPDTLPEQLRKELLGSPDHEDPEMEQIATTSSPSPVPEPVKTVPVELRPEPVIEKKVTTPTPSTKPFPMASVVVISPLPAKLGPPPGFGSQTKVTSEIGRVSVSSTSTHQISPKPTPEIRMQRPFGNNSQAPFNPLNNYMQQQPVQSAANVGLGNIFGSASFGGSQESIRPPGSQIFGSNSPTNQARPGLPPAPQRQNSSSSWNIPSSATRSTGPPTPLQLDFRSQGPQMQDFQRASQPMPIFDQDLSQMQFSDDVQEEANGYFEAIYTNKAHLMTVSSLIDRLKGCKMSHDSRDHKLLACVVKNLFEEYKFFNDYPDRELKITAELYGGIIREGIINETSNLHFATAVRKVIESLQQPLNSNLYTFGLVALENCRNKLCTYPKVCSMINQLENFPRFPRSIQEHIQAGMSGDISRLSINAIPDTGSGRSTPPVWSAQAARSTTDSRNSATGSSAVPQNRTGNNVLSYTNVDTLVKATESEGAEVAQPAEAIVDKMSFLFNNLSQTNMGAKKEEVLGLIADHGEPFIRWLAQYIVMKRVSIEQNFQPLYNTFVQVLDHPLLDVHIKKETFRNIRILLRSDKRQAASNYSDRQLLKNLGMWLGAITIARSKPILLNELDLKSLLLEAYYKGQQELLFVVPFIAKILLSCSKTPIFSASCAWIKSILKVLAELHNEPDLKINLKFEIEVLCKELSVDLQSLPIEGILKDTEKLVRVQQQLSEIKMLAPPNQFPSSSPIPRPGGETLPAPGSETKPSTPQPDAENAGPEPVQQSHFAYQDINVVSYEGLAPHTQIKSNLPLFQLHPHLRQVVRPSLTVAIKELIGPVSERAQKIAMTVTENLIRKDFALDPNEKNLKVASFHMMRAMTAGMAMITCRDPLAVTMANSLQNAFSNALRNSVNTPESAKMIDEAAQVITAENVELATNFIVKTACEKAASEMEKRLDPEFQKRILARQAGKPYCDETAQAIQSLIPEQIAFQGGETPKDLMDIYMQFSSRICGFKPSVSEDLSPEAARPLVLTEERTNDLLATQLQMIIKEVDNTMGAQPNIGNKAYQAVGIIRDLLSQLAMNPRDSAALGNVIGKSVEHFLHAFHVDPSTKNPLDVEWPRRLRDLFIGVTRLCLTLTVITEIARKITSTIINLNIDYKWNVEAIEVLYKHNLIQTSVFDQHIASKMQSGPSMDQAAFFAQRLYRVLTTPETRAQFQAVFPNTYEQLLKITQMVPGRVPAPGEPQGLNSPLLENTEPAGEHELSQKVVETVLREWITICYTPAAQRSPQDALSSMIHVMHDHGCLSTDEKVSSFFKTCTEMCVDVTIKMQRNDPGTSAHHSAIIRQRCYYTLDAYVKLIALMIKYSDGNQTQTKITLLKKILSLIGNVLTMDHETRGKDFNAMPYHRILITLFNELTTPDGTALDQLQWSVMEAFGQTLFLLQPRRVPGFTYAWLDIVGHRNVIGKLLSGPRDNADSIKMQAMYTQLIICHLKFMSPFLRNIQMTKHVQALYKGTLRVLLVILHDFPELLCEFHYVICDTIPANCVQLRNIVLSAYPREMRLPDPFALNFKQVDTIPDMAQEPKSNLNMSTIIPEPTRQALDDYLTNRTNVDFLTTLPNLLQVSQTPGQKYNTTVLNAVVLYVGIKAIESLHQKRLTINIQTIAHTSYMDVFQNLAVQLCTEGRYLLFNAIANQLRYPNAHTHYFSCVFLFLFLNSDYDAIQEQITRILFERLVALRPHPWGLLITFIELIKNPVYNFWKFEFTRCAPEIERLFQNVANTCVPSSSRNPNESASRA